MSLARIRRPDTGGDHLLPSSFRIVGEPQRLEIRRRNHSVLEERIEIDDARPIIAVEADDGDRSGLARLHEREDFETSASVPNPPGKAIAAAARSARCILRMVKEWNWKVSSGVE